MNYKLYSVNLIHASTYSEGEHLTSKQLEILDIIQPEDAELYKAANEKLDLLIQQFEPREYFNFQVCLHITFVL